MFPSLRLSVARRSPLACGLTAVGGLVGLWLTAVCLFGSVEQDLAPHQIGGGKVARVKSLRVPPSFWPGELRVEVLEDGRSLGPRVEDRRAAWEQLNGAYAIEVRGGVGRPSIAHLHLSSSDGTRPSENGRRYAVRYPRRMLPAAAVLVTAFWTVFFLLVIGRRPTTVDGSRTGVAPWSAVLTGVVYSLFVIQAWLPQPSAPWLLAVAAVGLAPALARSGAEERTVPEWAPWIVGLVLWSCASALGGSSYASWSAASGFVAVCLGGSVLYFGFRGLFRERENAGASLMVGLFLFAVGASLARSAGFDPAGSLASLGLVSEVSDRVVNLWTTKFVGHWVVVVTWCTLAVLGGARSCGRSRGVVVAGLGLLTVGVSGSKSGLAALAASSVVAIFALRWPKLIRRSVVYCLVLAVLCAPLLAGAVWRGQYNLPADPTGGPSNWFETDVRGGIWEFSRQLVGLEPVTGWGFGASENLPGRDLSIAEAFGLDAHLVPARVARHPVLAGGHPHNAALLTWLDLGLVGALLLAGLLVAAERSIAGVERQREVHAALIGLLVATVCYLAFNYPVWEPEVASIVWATVVLGTVVLPAPRVTRRSLTRAGIAASVVLAIGCVALLHERLSWRSTVRTLHERDPVLALEEGRVVMGDEARSLVDGPRLDAGAALVEAGSDRAALIHGWAYSPEAGRSPKAVLVFIGEDLAGVVRPERPTPEVFLRSSRQDLRALFAGFWIRVDPDRIDLRGPVTVVSLYDGTVAAGRLSPLVNGGPADASRP